MPTTKRKGLPSVWVTHIAAALVGDRVCLLKPWLKANFTLDKLPGDFDSATWRTEHTALVNETVAKLKAAGWTCKIEGQNFFKLKGKTAEISGKPDIVARKGAAIKVLDAKTGAPQDSHSAQVAIYVMAIPMAWGQPDLQINGEVVYRDHSVAVHWEAVQPMKAKFFDLMRRMGSDVRPDAVSSESECRWCDITQTDCHDRFTGGETVPVLVSEW